LIKIVHHYFIILNVLYTYLFRSKRESTYFKFGRKVNWPKREGYVFDRKRSCPALDGLQVVHKYESIPKQPKISEEIFYALNIIENFTDTSISYNKKQSKIYLFF
jgi:hypothetical protein